MLVKSPYRNYYQLFHHKDIADPATFEIIADDLAKDKHQTYSIRYVAKKTPTPVFTHQY